MGLKVGGTEVVSNSRELKNIASIDSGTVTAFNSALNTDPTKGTLTKTFAQNETADITLSSNVTVGPVVSATKEVPQTGVSTKGNWDVNSTASNYDFHDTATNVTLTPSTIGYDLSVFSYDSKSFNVNRNIQGIDISSDGTRIYYAQNSSYMRQRTLSTAFDISTAGSETYYDSTAQDNDPKDITFKPDGTKMYVTGDQYNQVAQYSLSTAWDITTASYDTKFFQVQSQMTDPKSTQFKSDGTKMYVMSGSRIYEYSLSTAWDVTTASYTNNNLVISGQDSSPNGMALQPDGTKMYVVGVANDKVYQYNFGTAWDLSTLSYNSSTDSFSSTSGQPRGIAFSANGGKLYIGDFSSAYIYQFTTGTDALALGSGSFASTDVGKRIVGNGGDVILTSTSGAFSTTGGSAFNDNSTIAAGSWQMFGLKSAGDADGITMSGVTQTGELDISAVTYANIYNTNVGNQDSDVRGVRFNNDGTKMFVMGNSNDEVFEYNLSSAVGGTPYQVNTATYQNISFVLNGPTNCLDVLFNNDGTKMYVPSSSPSPSRVYEYNLTTPFSLATGNVSASNTLDISGVGGSSSCHGITFNNDGTKFYVAISSSSVFQYTLTTAFDLSTASYANKYFAANSQVSDISGVNFNSDGTSMYISDNGADDIFQYNLSTAYDVSTASYANKFLAITQDNLNSNGEIEGFCFADNFSRMYVVGAVYDQVIQFNTAFTESITQPTQQYHVGVTNTSGRIDSSSFIDINSMTAAQNAGTGTVHYAVSTDGRTTWSVAKGTDGVRPIVRNNSGTWQYNSGENSFGISSASYTSTSLNVNAQESNPSGIFFKPDGTKMYITGYHGDDVNEYNLSTAFDITSATYSQNFSVSSQDNNPQGIFFRPDGLRFWMVGSGSDRVREYYISTAWDISTSTYVRDLSLPSGVQNPTGIFFKSDGTKMYVVADPNKALMYTLSGAWNVATATLSHTHTISETSLPQDIFLKSDGTKVYILGESPDKKVYEYNLSTAYDLSTISYSSNSFNVEPQSPGCKAMTFKPDGSRMYILGTDNDVIYEYNTLSYGTSATWTNGAVNDELYTLQQALSLESNRMDKTQLDAVADANHFSTGTSLDLMIALRIDTAASTLPTSDGVTLNYDAAALNEGAVLGTDYDFFHPSANKVQIKSLAAQNLKVRVV